MNVNVPLTRDKSNDLGFETYKDSDQPQPVLSEYSLCTEWVAKGLSFLHMHYEDCDQTS